MIRCMTGVVRSISTTGVLLDVSGLGFDILCSRGALSLCGIGERVTLVTYLQISEAGVALFGFADERERELFLKITTIKGIGGRTGIAVLSALSGEDIVRGAAVSDVSVFMRVPGVGKKTAERICFELKNLIPEEYLSTIGTSVAAVSSGVTGTVSEALRSLGFNQADINAAFGIVRATFGDDFTNLNEEKLLKAALKELQVK